MNYGDDFEGEIYDNSLDEFETYEDYLNYHITKDDLYYLEDWDLARQLVELGYHAKNDILSRDAFNTKKKTIEEARKNQNKDKSKALAYTEVANQEAIWMDPFLSALAEREERVLNGRLMTIIFIRDKTSKNEISGYIDYAHRLKTEDFKPYFEGKKKLLPKPTDLSFYNWDTGYCVSNDSPNFKVDASSGKEGLLFRNKRDRKIINVDPNSTQEDTTRRIEIPTTKYIQVVFYDHETRRKN